MPKVFNVQPTIVWLTSLFFATLCFGTLAIAQSPIYFSNVDVFDGERKIAATNVLIADGKIEGVGDDLTMPEGAEQIDGTGKTLLPGLIDCHTHVWSEDSLQQAAIFGVTTELDMMSVADVARDFRLAQAEGNANHRADFFSAGGAVTVKKGHGTQFGFPVPTLDKSADAGKFVADRVREGSDYIKIILEDGSAYGMTLPTLSDEMVELAVKAAHEHDKLAVAHISTKNFAKVAFESDVDGLVHLFADEPASDELVELAKSKGAFIAPTACVVSNSVGTNYSKWIINDERVRALLNNENLSNLARQYPRRPGLKGGWDVLKANILAFHQAGVPILAGTDAPNPGTVHGASMHQELRMLVDAGLSNTDALAAATSTPALHFKLKDRGRIAAGLRADVFLVDGDPTIDIKKTGAIVGVWKAGHPIDRETRIKSVQEEKDRANNPVVAEVDKMISNFDEGEKVTASFGSGWSGSTDVMMGGNSTVEIKVVKGGASDTASSLKISGKTRSKQPAFSGIMFSPGEAAMRAGDISAYQGISFWAKGNGEDCQLMLFFQKRGFLPSAKQFSATKEWKKYDFKIKDFDGCDGTDVLGIWFGKSTPGKFSFQIDEVQLDK